MKKRKKKKINIEDLNEDQSPNMTTQEEFDIKLNKILEEKGIKKNMKITKDQLKEIFDIMYAQEFPLKNVPEVPIDPKTVSEEFLKDIFDKLASSLDYDDEIKASQIKEYISPKKVHEEADEFLKELGRIAKDL